MFTHDLDTRPRLLLSIANTKGSIFPVSRRGLFFTLSFQSPPTKVTMKFLAAIPAVLSAVSFALTMLALFAGHKKGFMEDYHVMAFNTSTLGHNFLSNIAGSSASSTTTSAAAATTTASKGGLGGLPDPFSALSSLKATATGVLGSLESSAASIVNDVGNDAADKLADELGIDQFYTIHIMDLCQGDFEPNATASGAWMNVTECTSESP